MYVIRLVTMGTSFKDTAIIRYNHGRHFKRHCYHPVQPRAPL